MFFLRKYNTATHVYIPIVKRAVVDFAVGADWTPAAGDVKISKDGGAAANVTNLPVAIAMGNVAIWDFSLTATEVQAAKIHVTVGDSATKAVEDQSFIINTYGNASAEYGVDFSDAVRFGLTALPNAAAEAAGGLYTRGSGAGQITQDTAGRINSNVTAVSGATPPTPADVADAVTDEALSGHTTAGTVGKALGDVYNANVVRTATATGGGATSITLDASASAVDDIYNSDVIVIVSGTGAGQSRFITDYVGSTKVATVAAWVTNPDNTSVFLIVPFGSIPGATAPTAAEIRAEMDANSTKLSAINTKTTNLPSDPADASDVAAAIAALNNLSSSGAQAAAAAALAAYSAATATQVSAVQTAVLAKLPSALTGNGNLKAAVKEIVDTVIDGDGNATPWGPA